MSKMSAKTRYEAFVEWHNWAQSKYSSMKKKKKVQQPSFTDYNSQK